MNGLSYLGADVIDATEMVCCIVGIGQIGKSIKKLFAKKNFNIFKKGSFHLGDFKSSIKKSFADTKVGIKKGFTDFKANVKGGYTYLKSNLKNGLFGKVDDVDEIAVVNKLDEVPVNGVDDILSGDGINSKYSTIIDEKVVTIDKEDIGTLADTFTDGVYKTVETTEDITIYRVFGGNADAGGAFATTTRARSRIQTKMDSALLPEWKNSMKYEAEIFVPKGTKLNIGTVEHQITMSGTVLKGGADQILLPQDWNLNWIKSFRDVSVSGR